VNPIKNERNVVPIGSALREVGISRATFFRWIKQGRIRDVEYRDRNGYRVFTLAEVDSLRSYAQKLVGSPQMRIPLATVD
jgi:predicted site-specific integrase-resolvase